MPRIYEGPIWTLPVRNADQQAAACGDAWNGSLLLAKHGGGGFGTPTAELLAPFPAAGARPGGSRYLSGVTALGTLQSRDVEQHCCHLLPFCFQMHKSIPEQYCCLKLTFSHSMCVLWLRKSLVPLKALVLFVGGDTHPLLTTLSFISWSTMKTTAFAWPRGVQQAASYLLLVVNDVTSIQQCCPLMKFACGPQWVTEKVRRSAQGILCTTASPSNKAKYSFPDFCHHAEI